MTLDQARAIIADNSLVSHQADWMLAGKILYQHYQDNPHLLKPVRLGPLTTDAPRRRETSSDILRSIRALNAQLTRDQANLEGAQHTSIRRSDPTVGGRRVMKLDGDGSSYFIQTAGDGTWLVQAGDLSGFNNGKTDIPTTDIARHKRTQVQRDAGAAWATKYNAAQRAKWGQAA